MLGGGRGGGSQKSIWREGLPKNRGLDNLCIYVGLHKKELGGGGVFLSGRGINTPIHTMPLPQKKDITEKFLTK